MLDFSRVQNYYIACSYTDMRKQIDGLAALVQTQFGQEMDETSLYNENGLRVQKTVNGVVTKYTLHGKNIHHMTQGDNELHFFYDAQNKPAVVVYNGTPYSYVKNLQGDIVAILDSNKNVVVSYVYDAWGRPISCSGTMANTLGKINPFRYRGYVYDEETELYYLESRYYYHELNRFISSDRLVNIAADIFVQNTFAYCINSPTAYVDRNGMWLDTFFDAVSLIGSICEVIATPGNPIAWASLAADVVSLAVPGVSGGGQIVRVVCKYDDVADALKIADKIVDSAEIVDNVADTAKTVDRAIDAGDTIDDARKLGQRMHDAYDPLKNVDDVVGRYDKAIPGTRIRPDVICEGVQTVYELKPFSVRNLKKGLKQAANYADVASGGNASGWTIVVDMYVK